MAVIPDLLIQIDHPGSVNSRTPLVIITTYAHIAVKKNAEEKRKKEYKYMTTVEFSWMCYDSIISSRNRWKVHTCIFIS